MPAEGDAAIDKFGRARSSPIVSQVHNPQHCLWKCPFGACKLRLIVVGVVLLFGIPVKQAPQPNLPSGFLSVFSANSYLYLQHLIQSGLIFTILCPKLEEVNM